MRKYIFVVLILMLAACAPRVRHTENRPTQASQPVTQTSVSPSTNIPASPSVNNVLPTPSTAIDPNSIPATFFAMNTVNPDDYPKLASGNIIASGDRSLGLDRKEQRHLRFQSLR